MRGIIFLTMFVLNNYCESEKIISWEAAIGMKDGDKIAKDCEKPMLEYCSNQVEEAFQHVLQVCPIYSQIKNCDKECVKSHFEDHCYWLEMRERKFWDNVYAAWNYLPGNS